jgi:hypothetical protein
MEEQRKDRWRDTGRFILTEEWNFFYVGISYRSQNSEMSLTPQSKLSGVVDTGKPDPVVPLKPLRQFYHFYRRKFVFKKKSNQIRTRMI